VKVTDEARGPKGFREGSISAMGLKSAVFGKNSRAMISGKSQFLIMAAVERLSWNAAFSRMRVDDDQRPHFPSPILPSLKWSLQPENMSWEDCQIRSNFFNLREKECGPFGLSHSATPSRLLGRGKESKD